MRRVMLIVGALAGLLVLGSMLLDQGEVITLITYGEGTEHTTQLWVVELDGRPHLRAGQPNTRWLARIRSSPEVELGDDSHATGERRHYRAIPVGDPATRDRVSRAMAEKYGLSDRVWSWIIDRSQSVAIELRPSPSEGGPPPVAGAASIE